MINRFRLSRGRFVPGLGDLEDTKHERGVFLFFRGYTSPKSPRTLYMNPLLQLGLSLELEAHLFSRNSVGSITQADIPG